MLFRSVRRSKRDYCPHSLIVRTLRSSGGLWPLPVIPDAATLFSDTSHKGHFGHGPRFRSRPQSIVCNADDFTFGRFSECA